MISEWNKEGVAGLGISQARILLALSEDGPLKASSLAELLCVTCGAVTGMADSLIEVGLIRRERSESDRRVVMLNITEAGEQLIGGIFEKRMAVMSRVVSGLSDDEMSELTRLLYKMIDHRKKES